MRTLIQTPARGQDIFADGASEQSGVYAEDESRTQQEAPQQQAANTQASVQQQSVSQSSVGIMALPIIGRAIAGLEGGAEAGAITGTIEPRAGQCSRGGRWRCCRYCSGRRGTVSFCKD